MPEAKGSRGKRDARMKERCACSGNEETRGERLTGEKVRRKRRVRGERLTDMDRDMLEWKGRDGEACGNRNTH